MKKLMFIILSLIVLSACGQITDLVGNETADEEQEENATLKELVSSEDIILDPRWETNLECDGLQTADMHVSVTLASKSYNYTCEYKVGDSPYKNTTLREGIRQNIFLGTGSVFKNHTVEVCCEDVCVQEELKQLCIEPPKEVEKNLVEEDFVLEDRETAYFYFTARKGGRYEIYVNSQCAECNENYFRFELMNYNECVKKQNGDPFETRYVRDYKRGLITRLSLPDETSLCIAVIHDDDQTVTVAKHVLVHGTWID